MVSCNHIKDKFHSQFNSSLKDAIKQFKKLGYQIRPHWVNQFS